MNEIKYLGEIGGNNNPMIMTVPISTDTDIKKGTPIFYNKQTVSTLNGESSTLIGILAEDYYCEENELIPGSGSGEIKVIVSHDAVYECDALEFTGGGDYYNALLWHLSTTPDDDSVASMVGAKMILSAKAESSMSQDAIGTIYNVTGCESQNTPCFFLDCKIGPSSEGDRFAFLPTYGYNYLSLIADGELRLNVNVKGNIKIIDVDEQRKKIRFMISDII